MSFLKEFIFEGEMIKNIDFYLLDSSSSENKDLIKSKIEQFKNVPEFFSYYSDKNIISLFESLDTVDKFYSDIYNQIMTKKFNTTIDKYISDLSNIILLYNLISKNQHILSNALIHAESYLNDFYSENNFSKESMKKMNNYIDNLINAKRKKKKRFSTILNDDNLFNKSHRLKKSSKKSLFVINRKTEEKNITINNNLFNNIKISTNNIINEETNINDLTTPKFPKKSILDENNIKDLDYSTKNSIFKQGSIQSYYTLASKKPFVINSSNSPENVNIPKLKKVKFSEEKNSNLNLNNIKDDEEPKLIHSKSNVVEPNFTSNNVDNISKKIPKKFSSMNLKTTIEKKMMKNFLGFINNLYKNKIINNEEKLKLKQLIIGKSAKIENLYNIYYENNKDEFINKLKNIII